MLYNTVAKRLRSTAYAQTDQLNHGQRKVQFWVLNINSKFQKEYAAKRRAPTYSRALRCIRDVPASDVPRCGVVAQL